MAKRSMYQLHLSTCVVLVLAAACYMFVYSQTGEWAVFAPLKRFFTRLSSESLWRKVSLFGSVLSFVGLLAATAIVCEARIRRRERD